MSKLEKKGKELERWMAQGPQIRSREMSEQVETFMLLHKIMLSLSTHMAAHKHLQFQFQGIQSLLLASSSTRHACSTHKHM